MSQEVDLRIQVKVKKVLGMVLERDMITNTLKISNPHMVDQMFWGFEMREAKQANVPIQPNADLFPKDSDKGEFECLPDVPYYQLVGALLYLSNNNRPDISFACSLLPRFMQDTRRYLRNAAKHVIRYLKRTHNHGIIFRGDSAILDGYSDAAFAGDKEKRK